MKITSSGEIACHSIRQFFSQYVYSNVFREIHFSKERRGFDLKSTFHITCKSYKNEKKKKKKEQLGKNLQNYESVHNETFVYEQKPIRINDINEAEEKEVKECVEKKKKKKKGSCREK